MNECALIGQNGCRFWVSIKHSWFFQYKIGEIYGDLSESPGFEVDAAVRDLREYLDVIHNIKKAGAKWHLALDF